MIRTSAIRRWLSSEVKTWKSAALPGLVIITLIVVARFTGALQPLEWMALDWLMRSRPAEPTDERVVVIGIDDEDINQLKTYPVPDGELAALITKLQSYQPAAIGLDLFRDLPIEPGHRALVQAFQRYPNLSIIEHLPIGGDVAIPAPKDITASQVVFSNLPFDPDGHPRRHLLGTTDPRYINTPQADDHYKYSLATQLATQYLALQGYKEEAGQRDPETLQIGAVEFPRVHPNTGAYINIEQGGTQVLLNYRSGTQPFRALTLRQIRQNQFQPEWIRGKVILIGMSAIGVKDFANVAAIPVPDAATYPGVKVHAHAVSQILAAVLDQRPLLRSWVEGLEYLWIVLWGILGIGIGRQLQAPWLILPTVAIVSFGLLGFCYSMLLLGWWIPFVPAVMALILNGAGLSAGLLYRAKRELEQEEAIRQVALEQVFNSIHNRPLQRLGTMMRQLRDQPSPPVELIEQLSHLDQDLRSLRQEIGRIAKTTQQIRLGDELYDLQTPLFELLQVVCEVTLKRTDEFPSFKNLFRVIDIPSKPVQMIDDSGLTLAQKDGLCRFLEEAISNVGKHGVDVTQIKIFCGQEQGKQVIRVMDNGASKTIPHPKQVKGSNQISGTQAALKLKKQLGGEFSRCVNTPSGVICEFSWHPRSR